MKPHSITILLFWFFCQVTTESRASKMVSRVDSMKNNEEQTLPLNKSEDSLFQKFKDQNQVSIRNTIAIKKLGSQNISNRLRKLFEDTKSLEVKENIAFILVFCGETDTAYFNFLKVRLQQVEKSGMPLPYEVDSKCQSTKRYNPEFKSWWQKNNLDSLSAIRLYHDYLQRIIIVSMLGDLRSASLLLKITKSNNAIYVAAAIEGLAKINDTNFVAPIIKAIQKQPDCMKESLSGSLIYFNTEGAIKEAKRNINSESFDYSYKRFKKNGLKEVYGF